MEKELSLRDRVDKAIYSTYREVWRWDGEREYMDPEFYPETAIDNVMEIIQELQDVIDRQNQYIRSLEKK